MGRKARLRKERKLAKQNLSISSNTASTKLEESLERRNNELCSLYSEYRALDVAVALFISNLWLNNISSPIKHQFALRAFASMDMTKFKNSNNMDSYESFAIFIKSVHCILPKFVICEDYIPESDWGGVRYLTSKGEILNIFYGNSVEWITDYIEAFKIKYGHIKSCLYDIELAIRLQDIAIVNIQSPCFEETIHPGHIEAPSRIFWKSTKEFLTNNSVNAIASEMNPNLSINLGECKVHNDYSIIQKGVLMGSYFPYVFIKISDTYIPIQLRNAASIVIDYWTSQTSLSNNNVLPLLSDYVTQLNIPNIFVEPIHLISKDNIFPYIFSGAIISSNMVFLLVLDTSETPIKQKVEKFIQEEDEIKLHLLKSNQITVPDTIRNIDIINIFLDISPNVSIFTAKENIIICLVDFICIMNSLISADDFAEFISFHEQHNSFIPLHLLDSFASYKLSDGVLVEGATEFTVVLDPHIGSNWRFKELKKIWENRPKLFPDTNIWHSQRISGGVFELVSKDLKYLCFSTMVGHCVVNFIASDYPRLDHNMQKFAKIFVQCASDAIDLRRNIIESNILFTKKRINVFCNFNENAKQLFSQWKIKADNKYIDATVNINSVRIIEGLQAPIDATFEVMCVIETIKGLGSSDTKLFSLLELTARTQPRFTLGTIDLGYDIPSDISLKKPSRREYKIARKEMAIVFKQQNISEGTYARGEAKDIIDRVRDKYREYVHGKLLQYDKQELVKACASYFNKLLMINDQDIQDIKLSEKHEVDYNRTKHLTSMHKDFTTNSQNCRYLLECSLSIENSGSDDISDDNFQQLLADVDCLLILYNVSDILHNQLDDVDLIIDDSYIPTINYMSLSDNESYLDEISNIRLGVNLLETDRVYGNVDIVNIDKAFRLDHGFTFTNMMAVLEVLAQWNYLHQQNVEVIYSATNKELLQSLTKNIEDLTLEQAQNILELLILKSDSIRTLLGKEIHEIDVPIWEHAKRAFRYTIRPLIKFTDNYFWGSSSLKRTQTIWINAISEGFLPADFDWVNINTIVRTIKKGIEKELENKAFEICKRKTSYVEKGIDFKRRFSKENIPDVGDFDVLAYFPNILTILNIECKYNKPYYCLKDMRRLRDTIFGEKGHISKIRRRCDFLTDNMDDIKCFLNWPINKEVKIVNVYVSINTYWWMVNPPEGLPIKFIQIDGLNNFIDSLKA